VIGQATVHRLDRRKSESDMTTPTASADFVISRVFDAPRALIWQCFTDPARMQEWWGPKGTTIVASKMDFRVGGTYLGAMRDDSGRVMWGKFTYREITPPERLVWLHSFSDEAGGLTRHPLAPSWPLELLTTVTFAEEPGGKTRITLTWSPHNATAEETQTFDAARDGMTQGWSGTFERLTNYLAQAK
jgi:uncharacterized protein YndB with AHSA1/START domain